VTRPPAKSRQIGGGLGKVRVKVAVLDTSFNMESLKGYLDL
jgi:hypothetical protein